MLFHTCKSELIVACLFFMGSFCPLILLMSDELIFSQSFECTVHLLFSSPSTWEYNSVIFVVQLRSKTCTQLLLHWLATRKQHFLLSRERWLRVRLLIMTYINSWMNWRLPSYVSDWTLIEWVELISDSSAVDSTHHFHFLTQLIQLFRLAGLGNINARLIISISSTLVKYCALEYWNEAGSFHLHSIYQKGTQL